MFKFSAQFFFFTNLQQFKNLFNLLLHRRWKIVPCNVTITKRKQTERRGRKKKMKMMSERRSFSIDERLFEGCLLLDSFRQEGDKWPGSRRRDWMVVWSDSVRNARVWVDSRNANAGRRVADTRAVIPGRVCFQGNEFSVWESNREYTRR